MKQNLSSVHHTYLSEIELKARADKVGGAVCQVHPVPSCLKQLTQMLQFRLCT